MKMHVFIATTKGVVAVQSITKIDDPDVMSVICLNGTTESLAISGNYHNFVKKGTGIIQDEFAGLAYRVDVSGYIDQGNSWQLGIYLAHYFHAKGILGDGNINIEAGDKSYYVTGEVNVKTRDVLPVEHVREKLHYVWREMDTQLAYIFIPEREHSREYLTPDYTLEIINGEPLYYMVNTLDSLINKLPLVQQPLMVTKNRKAFTAILLVTIVLALFAAVLFNQKARTTITTPSSAQIPISTEIAPVITPRIATGLQATYTDNYQQDCDQKTKTTAVKQKNQSLAASPLRGLCQLIFSSNAPMVIGVSIATGELFQLKQQDNFWQITLPDGLKSDYAYLLLDFEQQPTKADIERLDDYIISLHNAGFIKSKKLLQWFDQQKWQVSVYHHKISSF